MTGEERDELDDHRTRDEANIRWLLAAVLHHEPPATSSGDEDE